MADAGIAGVVRVCTRCHEPKRADLESFPPHKMGKYGLHSVCRPCKKLEDAERRNRPEQLARQKAWRDANKDKVRAYNQAYRNAGYRSTDHVNRWRKSNIDRVRREDARRARERRATDPAFRLLGRVRARLRSMIDKKGKRTDQVLGFTSDDLRAHLERQFTKGMGWHNMGEWHIDHIVPVASFTITSADDADFKACWALTNLRPMWADENRSKGDRRLTLL